MENRPLYSAEITDIIGTPPRWIVRAGGGLLLGLLLGVVALAGSLRLPERHSYPVVLRGTVPPYYLRQAGGRLRAAIASGQVVRQGQVLAHTGHPADTAAAVRAPFAGTFFTASPAGAAAQPGDTLGLLVPLVNAYRFGGRVALGQLAELRQAAPLTIEVPVAGQAGQPLALHGRLSYLDPTVRNGQATYVGHLDSLSALALTRQLAPLTQLSGTLLVSGPPHTVLHRLLGTR